MLDVSERQILIVGGGAVATRKATGLLQAGATQVRAVSPAFDADMPAQVQRIVATYDLSHLEGCGLVFAATDRAEINAAVVRDAHRLGLLVCRADLNEEEPADFTTPAILQQGPLTVTVAAGGNPALAARIRDELAARMDPRWQRLAEAMVSVRPRILARARLDSKMRKAIFLYLASDDAMDASIGGAEAVWAWIVARYPQLGSHA